jgi:predicted RNA-binding Zn-ribbon protein involved in translation (DUF1610 family)
LYREETGRCLYCGLVLEPDQFQCPHCWIMMRKRRERDEK